MTLHCSLELAYIFAACCYSPHLSSYKRLKIQVIQFKNVYKVHFKQKVIIFNLRSGIEAVLSRTENISAACDIWNGTHKGISKQHLSPTGQITHTTNLLTRGRSSSERLSAGLASLKHVNTIEKPVSITTEAQLFFVSP